jgi:hypothetical protein
VDLVETAYQRYEAAIVELEEISQTAQNESARVGAVEARVEIIKPECDLLREVGVLPATSVPSARMTQKRDYLEARAATQRNREASLRERRRTLLAQQS